jgi:hypothetical protein
MYKPLLCPKCGKILLTREGGSRAGEISRSEKSKANCRHCGTHWGLVTASDDFEWLINVVTPDETDDVYWAFRLLSVLVFR